MANSPFKAGRQIGPWTLDHFLGKGGNGQVWRCRQHNGRTVAVKFCTSAAKDKRYLRFCDEITAHELIGDHQGVLPIYEHHLPDKSGINGPAWFSMPEATPIRDALGGEYDLTMVVQAVAEIAETLVWLAERGIYHRDIKPGNLFQYKGHWVLGDFGLAYFSDKQAHTSTGEQLGPRNYLPFELIADAKNADPAPADVFMLAKTLYVLATRQQWPPQGQQHVGIRNETIETWIVHPRVRLLDYLSERSTATNPKERPPMKEFASELKDWLTPVAPSPRIGDLGQIVRELRASTSAAAREVEARNERWRLLNQVLHKFDTLVTPTMIGLRQQGLRLSSTLNAATPNDRNRNQEVANQVYMPQGLDVRMLGMGRRQLEFGAHFHYDMAVGQIATNYLNRSPIAAYSSDDGHVNLLASHLLLAQGTKEHYWCGHVVFPLGSAREEHAVADLVGRFTQSLLPALSRLSELAQAGPGLLSQEPELANRDNLATRIMSAQQRMKHVQGEIRSMNERLVKALAPFVAFLHERVDYVEGVQFTNSLATAIADAVRQDDAISVWSMGAHMRQLNIIDANQYISLISGFGIDVFDDNVVRLVTGHVVTAPSSGSDVIWSDGVLLPNDQEKIDIFLETSTKQLIRTFDTAFDKYTGLVSKL
jgi:serine/threonine protein kinase